MLVLDIDLYAVMIKSIKLILVFYGLRAGVLNMATMLAVVGCC
jgi:hypothetical protein